MEFKSYVKAGILLSILAGVIAIFVKIHKEGINFICTCECDCICHDEE